jgi:hypothetical protein
MGAIMSIYGKNLLGSYSPNILGRAATTNLVENSIAEILGRHPAAESPLSGGLYAPSSRPATLAALMGLLHPPPLNRQPTVFPPPKRQPLPLRPAPIKRRAFFSFHYDDIHRVNNVRQAWRINHPDSPTMRSFLDSSLWEKNKRNSDASIKELIRWGVKYTSAVCVLVGTNTYSRRYVRYEIARAIIEKKGLLSVHINSLRHHERRAPDQLGFSPLSLLGVYKSQSGNFYLCEAKQIQNSLTGRIEWKWFQYSDYTPPVALPRYVPDPGIGRVVALSTTQMNTIT